jgi:hypothetical protein
MMQAPSDVFSIADHRTLPGLESSPDDRPPFSPCSPVYNVCIIVHINKGPSIDIDFVWDEEKYQQVVAHHHVRFYEVIS